MERVDFRSIAKSRDLRVGTCVLEFNSPGIGEILKAAGCDFVFFDMEHSGFTFETVKSVLKYMHAANLPVMVRPPSQSYENIAMTCDMGADALLLPHVRSVNEARTILTYMKFPPQGRRGVAFGIAHDRYAKGVGTEVMRGTNDTLAFYATIEDAEAVEEVDEIAALDGVDGLIVGHNDLSASLGIHGEYDHPEFLAAVEKIRTACASHDKSYGRALGSVDEGVAHFAAGANLIIYSGDVWLMRDALEASITELRARCVSR